MALLFLTHCGWHLRGSDMNLAALPAIRFYGENESFAQELALLIQKQGVQIASKNIDTGFAVQFKQHSYQRRLAAVDQQTGQAQSYILILNVDFMLHHQDKSQPSSIRTAASSIEMQFDHRAVLGKDAEEERLKVSLLEDIARQISYQLQSFVK